MERYLEVWNDIKSNLKENLTEENYTAYFQDINEIYKVSNNVIYLIVPNNFIKNRIETVFLNRLNSQLNEYFKERHIFKLITRQDVESNKEEKLEEIKQETQKKYENGLNQSYTFDNFVVGASNRFAYTSALKIADQPGVVANPFYIFGDVGLGKTHLMQCVGNYIYENHMDYKVLYIKTEQFIEEYVRATENRSNSSFKEKFDDIDVLLIDDIQFLSGKTQSQIEFFSLFEKLFNKHKQIVITSDKKASDLHDIMVRLTSRFEWGVSVDVNKPDMNLRIEILKKKLQNTLPNPNVVPIEVLEYIASCFESNIRILESALNRVVFYCNAFNLEYTVDNAKEALKSIINIAKDSGKNYVAGTDIQKIFSVIANYFRLSIDDLLSTKRNKEIVYARQICWYIMKKCFDLNYQKIGDIFNGKDHTTVMYGYRTIEEMLNYDENTKNNVENIIRKLGKDVNAIN